MGCIVLTISAHLAYANTYLYSTTNSVISTYIDIYYLTVQLGAYLGIYCLTIQLGTYIGRS